ncbi:hypothetical protein NPIL_346461 [Nephila pilipes]|uniref:Mos1 transposase HTH domain-containing protein n=1 Tax=Nephila pilipes TaxID=299642 RepID=A0A8X6T9X0_NEPPI|nr:hypothetical protein NPIL_346461 [Nephila pilipes]
MQHFKDQCHAIKFCVALKKTDAETVAILREAYGDNTISQNIVHRCHKMFREGREDTEDEDRSGRTSTSHSDQNVKETEGHVEL